MHRVSRVVRVGGRDFSVNTTLETSIIGAPKTTSASRRHEDEACRQWLRPVSDTVRP